MDMMSIKEGTRSLKDRLFRFARRNREIDVYPAGHGIVRVRAETERPVEAIGEIELNAYECDLCLSKVGEGRIVQCPFCGRWICTSGCVIPEEGSCRSCATVIRLNRESIENVKDLMRLAYGSGAAMEGEVDVQKGP